MSRIRHHRHRKRSTAGEKPEVGRKHGGAASVHMRGEGIKAALRPDRKSRRKRSFGGVIARAGGGGIKRASGGELGEILDTSEPTAPIATPAVPPGALGDDAAVGPGSGVVPSQNWSDMTLGQIGASLMKRARDTGSEIGSPEDWTPRQIGMAALKAAMLPSYEAAKLGAYARDSMSPTVRDAIDNLPSTLRNARDTVGNWRDEAARELQARSAKEKADQEKNAPVSLQDYAERVAATIPGLNRIRAALSPKSNYEELAKTALARHVPGDDALSHMSPAPDPESSPPFWRAALVHGSSDRARGGKVKRREGGGATSQENQAQSPQQESPLNQPYQNQTAASQAGGLGQSSSNETPEMRRGQIDPQTGKPYTRASGGRAQKKWIQGAISHPGRMKKGAERAGMSTHEYMEKHKGDSSSLGSAARLGLRLSAASKGKKEL